MNQPPGQGGPPPGYGYFPPPGQAHPQYSPTPPPYGAPAPHHAQPYATPPPPAYGAMPQTPLAPPSQPTPLAYAPPPQYSPAPPPQYSPAPPPQYSPAPPPYGAPHAPYVQPPAPLYTPPSANAAPRLMSPYAHHGPAPKGMPPAAAVGLAFVAVVVATAFDVVFTKVPIPGVGSYIWYATTAISFGAAGYGSALLTRAGRGLVTGVVIGASIVYGAADLGLGLALENLDVSSALFLGVQGVGIGVFCGLGGLYRGAQKKVDDRDA